MKLSRREQGVLALLSLAGLVYVGFVYGIDPVLGSQQAIREEIELKRASLDQYRLVASERKRFQDRVSELQARVTESEGFLLRGDKVPVAAAEVQELLHHFEQETGVSIIREAVLRPKQNDMFLEVSIELSVKGSLGQIKDFLYRVETHDKLLTIPQLSIRSSFSANGPLSVDLHVAGHMPRGEKL
jgi:Tfp pilus assembly protein PilO